MKRYGPWAVVTGASKGLGRAMALELAHHGLNVVIAARSDDRLAALDKEIHSKYSVETRVLVMDLSRDDSAEKLFTACSDLEVGLLVNNAGIFPKGDFHDIDLALHLTTLRLNCMLPLELTHRFIARFKLRRKSGIIFVSSIQAFGAVPYMSNYSGTKAYDMLLGEGLRYELAPLGIDVLCLTPNFISRSGRKMGIGSVDPEIIVRDGVKYLGRRLFYTSGFLNKFYYHLSRFFIPRSLGTRLRAYVIKRGMPKRGGRK